MGPIFAVKSEKRKPAWAKRASRRPMRRTPKLHPSEKGPLLWQFASKNVPFPTQFRAAACGPGLFLGAKALLTVALFQRRSLFIFGFGFLERQFGGVLLDFQFAN